MHCELAEKDATKCCLAPTTKGARCRRARVEGNFCKQHFLKFRDQARQEELWAPALIVRKHRGRF